MKERCGNVIENKGSGPEVAGNSRNVVENTGAYVIKAEILLKTNEIDCTGEAASLANTCHSEPRRFLAGEPAAAGLQLSFPFSGRAASCRCFAEFALSVANGLSMTAARHPARPHNRFPDELLEALWPGAHVNLIAGCLTLFLTTVSGTSVTDVAVTFMPRLRENASVGCPSTMNFVPFGMVNFWLLPSSRVRMTDLGGLTLLPAAGKYSHSSSVG
jgi:hypothetical protein